ncbi:MAG: hypothetical protein KAX56_07630 [Phenylobacterium sp.]|nr:hypothetical protein [Phenylobacterium sp.]
MTSKPNALKHPIRDGFGFLAAAATAVVQLFMPTPRPPADTGEGDASQSTDAAVLKKRLAPYPVED